jgi:hypothetical protein
MNCQDKIIGWEDLDFQMKNEIIEFIEGEMREDLYSSGGIKFEAKYSRKYVDALIS